MTANQLQRIACRLSNSSWCRHWLNLHNSRTDVIMAVQCLDERGRPAQIRDLERLGFKPQDAFIYTIQRTNDDGTPFVSNIF